jgi:type IV pilus assembly protein PilC
MPLYQFEAVDNMGTVIRDTIEAPTIEDAQQQIRNMGYFVSRIDERKPQRARGRARPKKRGKTFAIGKVRAKQLCTFTRQFSVLQDAGLPILRSLRILEGQLRPGVLRNALIDVIDDIEAGATLSEAMAKHPKAFDRLYVNMIRAGEAGGALEVILRRLAEFKEKAQSLKRRVISAMVYPCVVMLVATAILAGILVFIVPKFKKIFEDFNTDLPRITLILLTVSDYAVAYWYLFPGIPVGLFLFVKLLKAFRWGKYIVDWVKLHLPVMGNLVYKAVVARTTRTLGTLVASGVPILESLAIVRDTSNNGVFERAFDHVIARIREGDSIAQALRDSRVVNDMVINMIDVGEETGELDTMLNKIADVYDEEVDAAVQGLVSLLEPMMIALLGGIIGFIVIALFMPLIKLISELSSKGG